MDDIRGRHWSIERSFIDREQAQVADAQARVLKSMRPAYARIFTPYNGNFRVNDLTVLQVSLSDMPPTDRKTFGDLIDVARAVTRAAATLAGQRSNHDMPDVFLNFYKPGASTGKHRDDYASSTVAVGLSGTGEISIVDADGVTSEQSLYATDALCLDNSVTVKERPFHEVRCVGGLPRIAIVNAER